MSTSHHFEGPVLFGVGAVGQPGQRVFYLQASGDGEHVTVKCEKLQAAALADYLEGILSDLPASGGAGVGAGADPVHPPDVAWAAGVMAVAYDEVLDRVVVVIEELLDEDEAAARVDGPANVRVNLTRAQVVAFIAQARSLVTAGRPPCRLCGRPLDPAGHACPRLN